MKNLPYFLFYVIVSFSFADTVSKGDRLLQSNVKASQKNHSEKILPDKSVKNIKNNDPKQDLVTFKKMLDILNKENISSEEYQRAAKDLEISYYHNASFETLELLSQTYREKGDEKNQIKVLERLTSEHPDNPKGYYLLGSIHKKNYERIKNLEKDPCQVRYNKLKDRQHKLSAIEWFSLAIEKDSKYEAAYLKLLPLLREVERWNDSPDRKKEQNKNSKTNSAQQKISSSTTGMEVLNLAKDMVRHFRKPEYYVDLCEAYYKNDFSSQARKACRIAVKKNPENPKAHLYHALAQKPNKIESHLMEVAGKFPQSELVQLHAGKWFLDKTSDLAVKYLASVVAINPNHSETHGHLAEFFFKSRKFEEAYKSFKTACFLDLKYIRNFRRAKQKLLYTGKKGKQLIPQFEKGIDECFNHFKENKSCS
ncbi:MAG: hypothetical protein OXB86_01690 [Bdellovibrionales bacterium]|nr:hypothetical protein [Bdellovibrionales bacterium]